MGTGRHEIGMIGLGAMGRNVLLNMADHGFLVAGYDKAPRKVEALQKESAANDIPAAAKIQDLIGLLRRPRAVMMLVPAGPPVDSAIGDVLPHLEKGDLIVDAGNSRFNDTNLRARNLEAAWRLLMPVLDVWKASHPNDFPNYAGGTGGPDATPGLLVQQGHSWPAPVESAGRSPRRPET